jgi:hypothetical protein
MGQLLNLYIQIDIFISNLPANCVYLFTCSQSSTTTSQCFNGFHPLKFDDIRSTVGKPAFHERCYIPAAGRTCPSQPPYRRRVPYSTYFKLEKNTPLKFISFHNMGQQDLVSAQCRRSHAFEV